MKRTNAMTSILSAWLQRDHGVGSRLTLRRVALALASEGEESPAFDTAQGQCHPSGAPTLPRIHLHSVWRLPCAWLLCLATIGLPAAPAAAEVAAWTAEDWPAEPAAFAVEVEDGDMAMEAYAGGRHRVVGQRIVPPADTRVSSVALRVGQARGGANGAAVRVRLAELRENEDPDAGRTLAEGVVRLPEEIEGGSIVGFRFDPVTLRGRRPHAFTMEFVEPAPLRAVSFRTGRLRTDEARFALNQDRAGWKVSNDRAQEARWYEDLPASAYTDVPRRLEDLDPQEMTLRVVEDAAEGPVAAEQPLADPDLFNVHGIWHGGGGRQDFEQGFTWPTEEPLAAVRVRVRDFSPPYHGGASGAPLELAIAERTAEGRLGPPVGRWRGEVPERLLKSTWLDLDLGSVSLESGGEYVFRLSFPEPGRERHLSLSAVIGDPYGGGRLLRARNGGGFEPLEKGAEVDLSFQLLTPGQAGSTR